MRGLLTGGVANYGGDSEGEATTLPHTANASTSAVRFAAPPAGTGDTKMTRPKVRDCDAKNPASLGSVTTITPVF